MGFGNNGKAVVKKEESNKEAEKEWWQRKYGDRFKTYEEFEKARIDGIIDPFND